MDNVNVLIIEDTPAESDALVKVLKAHQYEIVGVARTYKDALALYYSKQVDIVIIDVFLNGHPEGVVFAETISAMPDSAKPFVFLTSSTDRNIFERAKLTHPFSFLMKPFNELEVLYAIEMAVEKFYAQPAVFFSEEQDTVVSSNYLFIKKNDSLKKVKIADILYIEVEERYCSIFTEAEKFVIMLSLTKMLDLLDPALFSRTHRNYIVNTEKISEVHLADGLIQLTGELTVPFSESYKDFIRRFRLLK